MSLLLVKNYISLFPSVCCAHTSFSLMLCLMGVLGLLITKISFLYTCICIFHKLCTKVTFNPSLACSDTIIIPMHGFYTIHMQFYYNHVLMDWNDAVKNAALTFHTLILQNLHLRTYATKFFTC